MPSFRDLPDPGIEPTSLTSPLADGFFTTSATWEALCILVMFMFVYLFSWYLEEVTFFHQLCSPILSGVSYKLALTKNIASDWTAKAFAICFYGEPCFYSCWPSATLEGVQGGVRHSVLQGSYSKSWKMMLWKCCTRYASKFGKLSSGHRTGKGQFSFQSQRQCQRMLKLPHNCTHLTR